MTETQGYVLGESERAARRLAIQDAHLGAVSEQLIDGVAIRPNDRVVELGCGPGGFSRRVLCRLGAGGVLVAVDQSESLLAQASEQLAGIGPAGVQPGPAGNAALRPGALAARSRGPPAPPPPPPPAPLL